MHHPRQTKRAHRPERKIASAARLHAQTPGQGTARQRGAVAHGLMPPCAPQAAQATVQHGGEGTEEHGVGVWTVGRGQEEERRGAQDAAESDEAVDEGCYGCASPAVGWDKPEEEEGGRMG